MAAGTKTRITANVLQTENATLTSENLLLKDRLEVVADMLTKSGMLDSNPHSRYRFVHGLPLHHFPTIEAEFRDIDGLMSEG